MREGAVPIRTCVGCGACAPQAALVRFVATASGLALDTRRRLPGRGAWLHREPGCWGAFVQRRGAVRSLRADPGRAAREALRDVFMTAAETS
ncbi:MAG TPA: YlxR family protein [Candidatus Binatia bacterium]|nr:YlxR family protein [Candidatus Binatia bacterium]